MTVNNTTSVVSALEVHLALDVEIDHTHNTIRREQRSQTVNDRVEFRNHAETVAHSEQIRARSIRRVTILHSALANTEDGLVIADAGLVLAQLEASGILANDNDVFPPESLEPSSCDCAQ